MAQGRTNRQIATELFLSPRTVDGYVDNIRAKLGFGLVGSGTTAHRMTFGTAVPKPTRQTEISSASPADSSSSAQTVFPWRAWRVPQCLASWATRSRPRPPSS